MSQVQVEVEDVRVFTVTLPGAEAPIQIKLGADIAQDLFNELYAFFGVVAVQPETVITRSGITYLNDEGEAIGFAPV